MIVPGIRALVREMVARERTGVPRMAAQSQVFDRYNLCRFPPHHDPELVESPDYVIALMRENGWPRTKAGYVRAMFAPFLPRLPLDRDVAALVPDGLAGAVPTKATDVLFDSRPYVDAQIIADLAYIPAVCALCTCGPADAALVQELAISDSASTERRDAPSARQPSVAWPIPRPRRARGSTGVVCRHRGQGNLPQQP